MDAVLSVDELIHTADRWGWRAVAITDLANIHASSDAMRCVRSRCRGIKVIFGMEGYLTEGDSKTSIPHNITILVKNKMGLHHLYELISLSYLQFYHNMPHIPKGVLHDYRESLLLGSAGLRGELVQAIAQRKSIDELAEIVHFYDYLEIQPSTNYVGLLKDRNFPNITSDEDLKGINRKIAELSKMLDKMLVATGGVCYLNPMDSISRHIIRKVNGKENDDVRSSRFLRTTDKMLKAFGYLDDETAYKAVVVNPNRIAESVESLNPISNERHFPVFSGADEVLKNAAYQKAHELYGYNLPEIVRDRLGKELAIIVEHGCSSLYLIQQKLAQKVRKNGYDTCSNGLTGASFIAYLLDFTDVNPLPPHWFCTKCQYSEFITDNSYSSGFDLPRRDCPNCGTLLTKNGHDIHYAIAYGFDGDRMPEINLNIPRKQLSNIRKYTRKIFGKDKVFAAGTISTVTFREADSYVQNYFSSKGRKLEPEDLQAITKKCRGVKKEAGTDPTALIIVPPNKDIHCFTPIQQMQETTTDEFPTTHFDYHTLYTSLLKIDILGHPALDMLKILEDSTKFPLSSVPFDDESTLSLFRPAESLGISTADIEINTGTLGIPEFHNRRVRQILCETQPTCFSDLVKISALYHGINVWEGNGRELIRDHVCKLSDLVGTRDDVMTHISRIGIHPMAAFSVMESIRKGKGLYPNTVKMLKGYDVPEWYIEACQKIGYLLPRAHVVEHVIVAYRMAYYKAHYPQAFYQIYFMSDNKFSDIDVITGGQEAVQKRIKEFLSIGGIEEERIENLQLALEMYMRGYSLEIS